MQGKQEYFVRHYSGIMFLLLWLLLPEFTVAAQQLGTIVFGSFHDQMKAEQLRSTLENKLQQPLFISEFKKHKAEKGNK